MLRISIWIETGAVWRISIGSFVLRLLGAWRELDCEHPFQRTLFYLSLLGKGGQETVKEGLSLASTALL